MCGPEQRGRQFPEGSGDAEEGAYAGGAVLGVHMRRHVAAEDTRNEALCTAGQHGDDQSRGGISDDHGVFVCDAGVYKRNAGFFPGDGKYEGHACGNGHTDLREGCFCVYSGAADGDDGRSLCVYGWLDAYASV